MKVRPEINLEILFKNKSHSSFDDFYYLWRGVWDKAFKDEFNLTSRLPSDKFTSQDIIIGISYLKHPVAMISLRKLNLKSLIDTESTSLIFWPQEVINDLKAKHQYVYSCENLSLDPSWRDYMNEIRLKDLMFMLVRIILLKSDETAVISCVRNFKSVQKSSYQSGALCLLENQVHPHIPNQNVDYVLWDKFNLGPLQSTELFDLGMHLYSLYQQQGDPNVHARL